MNITLMKNALGILALGLIASGAQAGWERGGYGHAAYSHSRSFSQQIDARQERQMERIQHGARSGQLTRREFRELMQEQQTIRAMERRFRADGRIDAREFRRLDHALDVADRNIRVELRDRQARAPYGHGPRFN